MTSKFDAWLTAAPDTSDEDEYIDQRVSEILKTDLDPSDAGRMAEAISEASPENQQIIRDYIEQSNWTELGRKLYCMAYEYMEHYATLMAQDEIQKGYHL